MHNHSKDLTSPTVSSTVVRPYFGIRDKIFSPGNWTKLVEKNVNESQTITTRPNGHRRQRKEIEGERKIKKGRTRPGLAGKRDPAVHWTRYTCYHVIFIKFYASVPGGGSAVWLPEMYGKLNRGRANEGNDENGKSKKKQPSAITPALVVKQRICFFSGSLFFWCCWFCI